MTADELHSASLTHPEIPGPPQVRALEAKTDADIVRLRDRMAADLLHPLRPDINGLYRDRCEEINRATSALLGAIQKHVENSQRQEGPQQPHSDEQVTPVTRKPYPRKKRSGGAARPLPVDDGKRSGVRQRPPELSDPGWRPLSACDRQLAWPGVYVLYDGENVVYVGQSCRCIDRIGEHQREGKKKWTHASIWCEAHFQTRLRLEGQLILEWLPKYNRALCLGIDKSGEVYELGFVLAKTRKAR